MYRFTHVIPVSIGLVFSVLGCQSQDLSGAARVEGDWLIPINEVYDGGPGKDGIPALLNPIFVSAQEASYLSDNDLVIGVKIGNEIRAYPHPILDWHEIVNDDIAGTQLAITYCPLTGSGIAWNRVVAGTSTTFGVSGLLYNSNLIPYDRATNSNWSQMLMQSVNGAQSGTFAETHHIVETTWRTWKTMYPATKVVSSQTGYSRPYGQYPYGDYKTNSTLLFPVSNSDSRLARKERVLGILVGEKTKVYRLASYPENIGVANDLFNNVPIAAAGSKGLNFILAFESQLNDGTTLIFDAVQNSLPIVMVDQEGTKWDIWGKGVEGPRAGTELRPARSYVAYWFAWAAFYPGADIHGN